MLRRITVRVTDDQAATLRREAKKAAVSPSAVVQAALDALADAPSSGAEIRSRIRPVERGGPRPGSGRKPRATERS